MVNREAATAELSPSRRLAWLSVYFVSGACSLTYQIVWTRLFAQVIGSTVYALSMVTAIFMAGLAFGSAIGGRIADRATRPFAVYAAVEAATVLMAIASFLIIPGIKETYALAAAQAGALRIVFMIGLPLLLVAPATTLMGAGMPILARMLSSRISRLGRDAGTVYVTNTAGALVGAALTGFVLIRWLGVTTTWIAAAGANSIVVGIAVLLSRRQKDVMSPRLGTAELRRSTKELSSPPMSRKLMLTLFVISGFLSFGYELFWTRSLITILGNSTYAISSMLMVTLLGLVVGGGIMTRIVDRIRRPLMVLGAMEAGIGVTSLVALPILIGSLYTEGVQAFFFAERGGWAGSIILRFGAASTALLVPSILNGAALPLMLRTVTRTMASRGRDIGLAYAADAGGNVLGVLVPAFVVLPILGVSRGLLVLGLANLALGFVYLVPRQGRWLAFPVAATLLTLAAVVPINFQFPSDTHVGSDPILFYEEGVEATTRVYRKQDTGDYHMSVDGVFIGGSGDAARKEIVLAHLPTSICPGARSVLTVGLGSGVLAAELASYEHLRKISVVEIAPSVARGAEAVPDWAAVYPEDPRVDLRIDDVMNYLLASDERYDIVISDGKSRPTARGNGLFFSADYYEALRSSLAEEGVVFQWLSLHLAGEDFRTILRTFSASFKHVALWWLPDTDAFLIGSDAPFSIPASGHAFPPGRLLDYGITSSAATADLVVTTGDDLRGLAGPGNVSTLDRPVIEFFSIRDYASPASSMIAANLELLAYATAENEELEDLLTLLADAYSGNANRADTDDRALALRASSPPIAAAISRYFVARASGRLRSDDPAAALEYAQRSLEALPDSLVQAGLGADAFYYRGLALVALGDQQGAVEALVAAVEARPHRPAFRVALARSLVAAGDTTGAIKQYEAILSIMPENVPALQSVGVATAARGRPADALRLLEKAHTLEPETPAVIDSYAWVLHLNGRTEAARRVVQRGGAYASGRPDFENRRRIILEGEDAR